MAVKTRKTEVAGHQDEASSATTDGGFFPTVWLIASYLVLVIAFFLPVLMPGRMIYGSDYLAISYPFETLVTRWFGAGELPKWIPYVYGGVPFFANPMDIYNPVTLLLRLLRVPTYMHLPWIFITHFFLAGTGMYLLVRELGARRFAAYLAGLAFMFSGYLISFIHAGHEGRAIVATLAPLFLFALHRAIRTGGLRWFILGGAVLGSALLSNQIQSAYYLLIAAALWSVFTLWGLGKLRVPRQLVGRLAGGALILAIGFAMAAVNFLPFLGYVDASPRGGEGRGYAYATSWAMPPAEITGLAVPERSGILQAYWGENGIKLHTEYVGAFVLLLVVLGAYVLRQNRYFWFFVGLGVLALTFSFGGHTPIYRLYYEVLPGTSKFRAPSISFFLLTMCLAAIAGLALDRVADLRAQLAARAAAARKEAEGEYRNVLRIGAAALAVVLVWGLAAAAAPAPDLPAGQPTTLEQLRATQAAMNHPAYVAGVWRFLLFLALSAGGLWLWLRGTLSYKIAAVLLGLVVVADLWIIDKKFLDDVPQPSVSFAPDQIADFLSRQERPFRVFVGPGLPQDDYLNIFSIELVGGEHGNQLQTYNEFLGAGEREYTDFHNVFSDPKFLALANARYWVLSRRTEVPYLRPVFEGRTRNGTTAFVYEYVQVLPRAFVVPTASQAEPPEGALTRMHEQDFDPTREVVLYGQPPIVREGAQPLEEATARVVRHEPTEVVIEVTAPDSAYLVLTDNYYPDWHAEVDGSAADMYRANHTFRAVPVPPGTNTVAFHFESSALRAGFNISVAVWIALLAYAIGLGVVELRRRFAH